MQADELLRIQKVYLEIKWGKPLLLENSTSEISEKYVMEENIKFH